MPVTVDPKRCILSHQFLHAKDLAADLFFYLHFEALFSENGPEEHFSKGQTEITLLIHQHPDIGRITETGPLTKIQVQTAPDIPRQYGYTLFSLRACHQEAYTVQASFAAAEKDPF